MGVAGDRREMMLAGRNERNRAQQDRLVIILGLAERALEQSGGIDRIAARWNVRDPKSDDIAAL